MQYPRFLKPNDTLYFIAPSYGSPLDPYKIRLDKGMQAFKQKGYKIKKGKNIFKLNKEESNTPSKRAKEFMDAYLSSASLIWSVAGGELMSLILPYISLKEIQKASLKWFLGYSDNTILTYFLTTACDIATIYTYHVNAFCCDPWPNYLMDVYNLITGTQTSFHSYDKYEIQSLKDENPLCSFNLTQEVKWLLLNKKQKVTFKGRCIGGCIDVLTTIIGTKYDYTQTFIEKYKNDGFIWYFDICELTPVALSRALFQLKASNYFQYVKGFLISRIPSFIPYHGDLTYKEVILQHLSEYDVPILMDTDLGHVPPCIPMVNGAFMEVTFNNQKSKVQFFFK